MKRVLKGIAMSKSEATSYSLQFRLVTNHPGEPRVELMALPDGPGETHLLHFEHWDSLANHLKTLARSTPFHLKVMQRTLHARLVTLLIDRVTGAPQVFSLGYLQALGVAS